MPNCLNCQHSKQLFIAWSGGYAEVLNLQQNRKDEGERMKQWAKTAWKNRRLSLAEALNVAEDAVKVPVIDTRICRCL